MAPSSSSRGNRGSGNLDLGRVADGAALCGLALGLGLYVMPFWTEGRLRWAFWLTLVSTVVHVFTSHRRRDAGGPVGAPSGPPDVAPAIDAGDRP